MWKACLALGLAVGFAGAEPAASPRQGELERAIGQIARTAIEEGTSGLSVAVLSGDDSVLLEGWGAAESVAGDAAYRVGGLTEAFLACAVLQLVEQGRLGLHDPLTKLLPELERDAVDGVRVEEASSDEDRAGRPERPEHVPPTAAPRSPPHDEGRFERITLAQLLTHTSGLPSYEDAPGARRQDDIRAGRVLGWLRSAPLEFEPGSCAQYSDSNPLLLGWIAQRASGLSVPELLATRVFRPAGMRDTGYRSDGPPVRPMAYDVHEFEGAEIVHEHRPHAFEARELCSTAPDLARWMRALVTHELVQSASFEALSSPPPRADGSVGSRGHGLDVTRLAGETCLSVGAGAFGARAHVAYYPGIDLTIAVLASGDDAPLRKIERRIARAAFGLPDPETLDLPLNAEEAQRYVGEYLAGCNIYGVSFARGELTVETPDGRSITLAYQGRDRFLDPSHPTFSLVFHLDGAVADSFTLTEHGVDTFARRMG